MSSIGFIGLGVMGSPMACHLAAAGHAVSGFNRSAAKAEALVAAGGRRAASVADAVREADVIITMLPDAPEVREVLDGPGGAFAHAREGALLVDMSTISPAVAREIAEDAAVHGLQVLDAPVSGGEDGAQRAALSIMVGGQPADFDRALPILQAMGTTVVHVGPAGSGQTVKAANQLIVAGTIQLVAEALTLVEAHDVDLESAVEVLNGGLAGSAVLSRKSASMLTHTFTPGFRLDLHAKDMRIVTEAARLSGVATPLGALASVLVHAMVSQGRGGLDHSALLLGVEQMSGRTHDETLAPTT